MDPDDEYDPDEEYDGTGTYSNDETIIWYDDEGNQHADTIEK